MLDTLNTLNRQSYRDFGDPEQNFTELEAHLHAYQEGKAWRD